MMNSMVCAAVATAVLVASALPVLAARRVLNTPNGTIVFDTRTGAVIYDNRFQDRKVDKLSDLPPRQFFERLQENSN